MRVRILVGAAVALASLGLSAAPAVAGGGGSSFKCNKTVNGGTINQNVSVNHNGVCVLNGVTVNGSVSVGVKAYFESNGSTISGNVSGGSALTLYIWNHSKIGGNVAAFLTPQVFVYDSTVGKSVGAVLSVAPGYGHFQVCGSTVKREIGAALMGPDILIGDPAAGCGANTVTNGDIEVSFNPTNQELYVIGNTVQNGDIGINDNTGAGDQQVHGNNAPNGDLACMDNNPTFSGNGNGTVGDLAGGQCAAATLTGIDNDDD